MQESSNILLSEERDKIEFNHFYLIPRKLARNKGITQSAKLIWGYIFALSKTKRGCYATNQTIADNFGITTRHVSGCIAELVEHKLIDCDVKKGNKRTLKIINIEDLLFEDDIKETTNHSSTSHRTTVLRTTNHSSTNNIVYNNIDNNSISKDIQIELFKEKLKLEFDILKEWNLLKEKYPIKLHKEGTKLHQKVLLYCKDLLDGTFGQKNVIDPTFLDQFKIPSDYPNNKFTYKEIIKGLENMAKLYVNGYGSEDKTWLKKMSLSSLVYNPRTRKSQLLKCMLYEPENKSCKTFPKCKNENWLDTFLETIIQNSNNLSDQRYYKLIVNINDLFDYHCWLVKNKLRGKSKFDIGDPKDFLSYYHDWLEIEYSNTAIVPEYIGTKAKKWVKFIEWLEDTLFTESNYISLWEG